MVCDRCPVNKAKGNLYCVECGEDLSHYQCPSCDIHREMGDRFCPDCGQELNPLPKKSVCRQILDISGLIITAVLACYILIESITAIYGIPIVWDHLPTYTHHLFVVIPKVVSFYSFSGPAVQVYYLLIMAGVLVCVYQLFKRSYRPTKEEGLEGLKRTPMYEMFTLFAALYFIEMTYIVILKMAGVDVSSPIDEDQWELMFDLLNASIYEELVCRVLYLGLPMLIIALILRKKDDVWYRYLLGGFGMNRAAIVLILFSALMFGFGHLGGWGWWKILPTFLFGLMSGYLYCKYGLYVTVCMHFLTDYLSSATWLGGGIPAIMMLAVVLVSVVGGIPFTISYAKRAYLWFRDRLISAKQAREDIP